MTQHRGGTDLVQPRFPAFQDASQSPGDPSSDQRRGRRDDLRCPTGYSAVPQVGPRVCAETFRRVPPLSVGARGFSRPPTRNRRCPTVGRRRVSAPSCLLRAQWHLLDEAPYRPCACNACPPRQMLRAPAPARTAGGQSSEIVAPCRDQGALPSSAVDAGRRGMIEPGHTHRQNTFPPGARRGRRASG
jgi:hypothetical protein